MRRIFVLIIITGFLIASLLCFEPYLQPVKAQAQTPTSFSDNFATDSGEWQYFGSAYRNQTNQNIVLTEATNGQAGIAFFNSPVKGSFTANFRYKAGGGWGDDLTMYGPSGGGGGGDGFTMFFYKQQYWTTAPIGPGGNLGFNKKDEVSPGYGVEFDSFLSLGDPSPDHIALIKDIFTNHLTYVNDWRVEDNQWHNVSVEVQESSVKVFLDQSLVLLWTGEFDQTYDGFGFSGTTGAVTNRQVIDDFSINFHNLPIPSLTTSCVSSVSQSSINVKINGNLTFDQTAISGAPILLSYSPNGGDSWQDLTLVNTQPDGSYSAFWLASVTGNYLLKATYRGNEVYSGTSNIISFAIEPSVDQNVFSVNSNSTITGLSFNSVAKELSFSVSGVSGTTGYVNVYIPKSLVNDTANLRVYLDNNQIKYTTQSQGDCWLLYFTYHHSIHFIAVSLDSSNIPITSPASAPIISLDWLQIGILLFMGVVVAVVVVGALKLLSKKENSNS